MIYRPDFDKMWGKLRKHSLLEGELTQRNGDVATVSKLQVVLTRRLSHYGSIIIHIVTVNFLASQVRM